MPSAISISIPHTVSESHKVINAFHNKNHKDEWCLEKLDWRSIRPRGARSTSSAKEYNSPQSIYGKTIKVLTNVQAGDWEQSETLQPRVVEGQGQGPSVKERDFMKHIKLSWKAVFQVKRCERLRAHIGGQGRRVQ